MITEEQNQLLGPYREPVKLFRRSGVFVGFDSVKFKEVYDSITGENLNTGCSGCMTTALYRTYDLIEEYETRNN